MGGVASSSNNGVEMFIENVQVRVKSPVQALHEREHLQFWVLVCTKVILGLQRRSVHSLRLCLCHMLVPRNVGRLVVEVAHAPSS